MFCIDLWTFMVQKKTLTYLQVIFVNTGPGCLYISRAQGLGVCILVEHISKVGTVILYMYKP